MDKFLTTSELAKLFNLNRQTLHFYDRKNVFKPAYKNPENGYRMYSHNQIAQLAFIIYLRTIGFSLEKIKELLENSSVDSTMEQLRIQSELLKQQHEEIFRIDNVIKRKMNFVKQKMENTDFMESRRKWCSKQAFVKIGQEKVLYENEIFYYFPTIVFYHFEGDECEKTFGAYIELDESKEDYSDQIEYTKEQECLCFYHHGSYETLMQTVKAVCSRYRDLKFTKDFICINIVDQFLENNVDKFITEIQIPILNNKNIS